MSVSHSAFASLTVGGIKLSACSCRFLHGIWRDAGFTGSGKTELPMHNRDGLKAEHFVLVDLFDENMSRTASPENSDTKRPDIAIKGPDMRKKEGGTEGMKPFRKKLIKGGAIAAFAAAAGASPFVALEYTGYSYFDEPDGRNIVCTIDPTCRNLTFGEEQLARDVFGDRIDYKRVKVFNRPYIALQAMAARNMAPNGNIYMPRGYNGKRPHDYSEPGLHQAVFIHEMAHVWQHQSGNNIFSKAIETWIENGFNYDVAYRYNVNGTRSFKALNLEQQAEMIEDYFLARLKVRELVGSKGSMAGITEACREMAQFERRLFIVLPIRREHACVEAKAIKAALSAPLAAPAIG